MRVLVADDHTLFRDGITSLLQAAGFTVVGQVGSGQAAVKETLRTPSREGELSQGSRSKEFSFQGTRIDCLRVALALC